MMDALRKYIETRITEERAIAVKAYREAAQTCADQAERLATVPGSLPNVVPVNAALQRATEASVRSWALMEVFGEMGRIERKGVALKTDGR